MTATGDSYELIGRHVTRCTGVDIAGHLTGRMKGHVDGQIARLGLQGPAEYLRRLERDARGSRLLDELLAQVLVHETFFYRFRPQLEALESEILPVLLASRLGTLRIWSAGCSRGPEAYTLAMIALRCVETSPGRASIEVLGTDMCDAFLDEARAGTYREEMLGDLPATLRDRFLERLQDGTFRTGRELVSVVRLQRHNLLEPPPGSGFHVVCCRNVLMYFRPAERRTALESLATALAPTGYLLVGHSESLRDAPELFAPDRRYAVGVYRPAQAMSAREEIPTREPAVPARAAAEQPALAAGPRILRLEGDYDADSQPEKLESLKQRLGRAIDERCDVVLEADGATMLDQTTARLIARAARHAASQGRQLVLRASREAVVRWAAKHGLPVSPAAAGEAGQP